MNAPITAAILKELFRSQKIVCTGTRLPTAAAMEELAAETEWLRDSFEEGTLIARKAQENVEHALNVLMEQIPSIIETNIRMADFRRKRGESTQAPDNQCDQLIRLRDAAQGVLSAGIGWGVFPDVQDWHDIAVPLSDSFRIAMRSSNPNLDLRLSNAGPVAKFLVGIIPLITGDTPDFPAVARHIQREAKSGNTKKKPVGR